SYQFDETNLQRIILTRQDLRACPRGYVNLAPESSFCLKCDKNTTTIGYLSGPSELSCDKCRDGVKMLADVRDEGACEECPTGHIATENKRRLFWDECEKHNCFDYEFFNYDVMICNQCVDFMRNSIGREPNTMAYFSKCKCPMGQPKIYIVRHSRPNIMECLDPNSIQKSAFLLKKDIVHRLLQLENFERGFYLINYNRSIEVIIFKNCDAQEERNYDQWVCLCELGYIYRDYECVQA
ncbi:MAG: hypothetical protein MHPSP_002980, partial [Paramarteilia canceri]